jgi:hypothetical protein
MELHSKYQFTPQVEEAPSCPPRPPAKKKAAKKEAAKEAE